MSYASAALSSPIPHALLITVLVLAAAGFLYRSVRLLRRLVRNVQERGSAFTLTRCIRAFIIAVALGCIAGGLQYGGRALVLFGLCFLAEELYETAMILLVLKDGVRRRALQGEEWDHLGITSR